METDAQVRGGFAGPTPNLNPCLCQFPPSVNPRGSGLVDKRTARWTRDAGDEGRGFCGVGERKKKGEGRKTGKGGWK